MNLPSLSISGVRQLPVVSLSSALLTMLITAQQCLPNTMPKRCGQLSDRWAVRATNTGYSGIIDPHGRTEWLSRLNTYELHNRNDLPATDADLADVG